jgi:hypothetical protein
VRGDTIALEGVLDVDGVSTYEVHITCDDVGLPTTVTSSPAVVNGYLYIGATTDEGGKVYKVR